MRILALETSGKKFSLAVAQGDKILKARTTVLKKVLSSSIIPAVGAILKSARLTLSDIDGIAVGLGPGSFTSLRVGLSTAKGLAYAAGKPLVGIPSLDVLAMNGLKGRAPQICAVTDARRQLVYAALYRKDEGGLKHNGEHRLLRPGELLENITSDTLFIGDGVPFIKEHLKAMKPDFKAVFASERDWHPSAKWLAKLAARRFEERKFDDIDRLVPLYLYAEDCQVQKSS